MEDNKEDLGTSSYEIIDLKKVKKKLKELNQKFIENKKAREVYVEEPPEVFDYDGYKQVNPNRIRAGEAYEAVRCLKETYDMFYTEVFLILIKNQVKEELSPIEVFRTIYSWNIISNQKTWIRLMRDIEDFDGCYYPELVLQITNRIPLFIKEFKRIVNKISRISSQNPIENTTKRSFKISDTQIKRLLKQLNKTCSYFSFVKKLELVYLREDNFLELPLKLHIEFNYSTKESLDYFEEIHIGYREGQKCGTITTLLRNTDTLVPINLKIIDNSKEENKETVPGNEIIVTIYDSSKYKRRRRLSCYNRFFRFITLSQDKYDFLDRYSEITLSEVIDNTGWVDKIQIFGPSDKEQWRILITCPRASDNQWYFTKKLFVVMFNFRTLIRYDTLKEGSYTKDRISRFKQIIYPL